MNLFEAGILPAASAGAVVGVMLTKANGVLAASGGAAAGIVGGAVVGWLFALAVMGLMSVFGVLWLAALKRPNAPPTESDLAQMTRIARAGIFIAVLAVAVLLMTTTWLHALILLLISAPLVALVTVARWQMQQVRRTS